MYSDNVNPEPPPRSATAPDHSVRSRLLLRELVEYRNGRQQIGETVLRVRELRREGHLITLEDGEHLIVLVLDNALCHWAAARDPLARLRQRICSWLTEPEPDPKD